MKATYQRTKSGAYRRQLRHPLTGQKISLTAHSLAELEIRTSRVRRIKEQLRIGEIDPQTAAAYLRTVQSGRPQTVAELWARYAPGISHRSRDSAQSNWNRRLEPYFGDLLLWQVTEEKMRNWASSLREQKFAPKTIRGAYDCLAGAFRMAVDQRELQGLPWGRWRPPRAIVERPREGLSSLAELEQLFEAAKSLDRKAWERGHYADHFFVVLVFTLTGMRQRELAALAWEFVEIDRPPFLLRVEFQAKRRWRARWPDGRPKDLPKNGTRSQLLHEAAVEALRAQREQLKRFGWYRKNGPIFPGRGDEWSECGEVLKPDRLRKIVEIAGLTNPGDWTTHSLRHSFCTLEVQGSGGDLRTSMKRTGHRSIAVLQGYLHPRVHGAPEPGIPALGPRLLPSVETTGGELVEGSAPLALPGLGPYVASPELERKRYLETERTESKKPIDEAAREWVMDGAPAAIPVAAKKALRIAYSRGYNRARKEGKTNEECQAAGRRSRAASEGAWGQAVARARRTLGGIEGSSLLMPAPRELGASSAKPG